jgi:hypothetical protein
MQENKDLVQEALVQMRNVEQAIAENAKGILQSTMKEEISQLVKESLSEQDDEEVGAEEEKFDVEDEESEDDNFSDNEEDEMDIDLDMDIDSEESPIDLTDASDEEILRVFKAMGEEDGIIVKKDGDDVHLKDNEADVEYLVKLGESEDEKIDETMKMDEIDEMDGMDDDNVDDIVAKIFNTESSVDLEEDMDSEEEGEVVYEIEFEEEEHEGYDSLEEDDDDDEDSLEEEDDDDDYEDGEMEEMYGGNKGDFKRRKGHKIGDVDGHYKDFEMEEESLEEAYNHKKSKKSETKEGKDMISKPKGVKGHGPKFTYKKSEGGFDEDKKEGPKSVGTGSAKKAKSFPKGENTDGKNKMVGTKKAETKEAARSYAFGSKEGRGLRKAVTPNRDFVYTKNGVKKESVDAEVEMLREKNEEYRKALNVFREKLNEVAIFNSNLAYATRLFTEHSTTKKEKINILRRFDNVETLKESKSLYKSMKEELSKSEGKSLNESVEKNLNKTVSSGSSTTLIESKTYENPQFLRMKDLMSKLG